MESSNIKYQFLFIGIYNGTVLKKYTFTLDEIIEGKANFAEIDNVKIVKRISTGQIDKNKNEIFKGDIVKLNNELYMVDFYNKAFALITQNGEHFEYMCNLCDMMGKVYEIVGNIYEKEKL